MVGEFAVVKFRGLAHELVVLEFPQQSLFVRAHQYAHKVILGFASPGLEDIREVGRIFHEGISCSRHDLGIIEVAVAGNHGVRPVVKAVPILLVDAHHLGDQQQRQGDRDGGERNRTRRSWLRSQWPRW